MAEEALSCFEKLLTSIPEWIADLEALVGRVNERQRQMLQDNQTPDTPGQIIKPTHRQSSKPPSSKSSRSKKEAGRSVELPRPQLPHLTDSDALRLSQRKRKTEFVASGDPSGPSKFRSRSRVVVYYDGDSQKRFEQLVRSVAAARNNIRKGRMGFKVDALSRTGSSSGESIGSEDPMSFASKMPYTRTTRAFPGAFGLDDGTAAFDRVDGCLEKGQALCERAAHQILRDGNCNVELVKTRELFKDALKFTQDELPGIRRRAEKAAARRQRSEERRHADGDSRTDSEHASIISNAMPPGEARLEVDVLEVDDASSESDGGFEYNVNAFQMSKMGPFRRGPTVGRLGPRALS